jgi:hypothetical protein
MARLHDTLYSFGATEFFNDYVRPVGWRWTDGQDWQVIESESAVYGGGFFKAVAASDAAIFAVKHAGYPLTEQHWLWKADTGWVGVGETIDYDNAIEYRSVAWREGLFVAVGSSWDASEDTAYWDWQEMPAAWSSVDGASWTRAPAPGDAAALCAVASTPDFFFAIGLDSEGAVTTWRSEDGRTWMPGMLPSAPRPELPPVEALVEQKCMTVTGSVLSLPGRYMAFTSAEGQTLTWTSNDGVSWSEDATLDVQTGRHSVAAIDGTVVAFGSRGPLGGGAAQALFVGTSSAPPE